MSKTGNEKSTMSKTGSKVSSAVDTQKEQAVKKRGRGGKYNFPNTVEPEDPEVVRAVLGSILYWRQRGIDDKPETDDEIQERIDEFLSTCWETGQRMTVEKMALALGITRETLHNWETGRTQNSRRMDIIKKAKDAIATYDAEMVTSGKMNPVPYIFRAKNYYGMRDQTDVVVTPNNPLGEQTAPEQLEEYLNTVDSE